MIYQEKTNHDTEKSKKYDANEGYTMANSCERQGFSEHEPYHDYTRLDGARCVDAALPIHEVKEARFFPNMHDAPDDDAGDDGVDAVDADADPGPVTTLPNITEDTNFNSVENLLSPIANNEDKVASDAGDLNQNKKVSSWQLLLFLRICDDEAASGERI